MLSGEQVGGLFLWSERSLAHGRAFRVAVLSSHALIGQSIVAGLRELATGFTVDTAVTSPALLLAPLDLIVVAMTETDQPNEMAAALVGKLGAPVPIVVVRNDRGTGLRATGTLKVVASVAHSNPPHVLASAILDVLDIELSLPAEVHVSGEVGQL